MDPSTLTYVWLIAGILLAISELFIPGGVVIFLGMAAMLVSGGFALGIVESLAPAFALWFVLSLALVFGARRLLQKHFKSAQGVAITDEDASVFGRLADVVDTIECGSDSGRIRFQGTTWSARAIKGTIPAGSQVRLVDRDNLCWIVEPVCADLELTPLQDNVAEPPTAQRERLPEQN